MNAKQTKAIDTEEVIAYRVTQLETAYKEGMDSINEKLDRVLEKVATKQEVVALRAQTQEEHEYIKEHIEDVRKDVDEKIIEVEKKIDNSKIGRYVNNLVLVVLTTVITALIMYFIEDITMR